MFMPIICIHSFVRTCLYRTTLFIQYACSSIYVICGTYTKKIDSPTECVLSNDLISTISFPWLMTTRLEPVYKVV